LLTYQEVTAPNSLANIVFASFDVWLGQAKDLAAGGSWLDSMRPATSAETLLDYPQPTTR
jgi:hypothetical protein